MRRPTAGKKYRITQITRMAIISHFSPRQKDLSSGDLMAVQQQIDREKTHFCAAFPLGSVWSRSQTAAVAASARLVCNFGVPRTEISIRGAATQSVCVCVCVTRILAGLVCSPENGHQSNYRFPLRTALSPLLGGTARRFGNLSRRCSRGASSCLSPKH